MGGGGGRNVSIGGETSHIGGETSHIGCKTSSVGAKRLTGGRNVLNWDKSSRRRGRNVLKMGAKSLGGRNVYGAKCPGADQLTPSYLAQLTPQQPYCIKCKIL